MMVHADWCNFGKVRGRKNKLTIYPAIINQTHKPMSAPPKTKQKNKTNLHLKWYRNLCPNKTHSSICRHIVKYQGDILDSKVFNIPDKSLVRIWSTIGSFSEPTLYRTGTNLESDKNPCTWRKKMHDFDPIYRLYYKGLFGQWSWPQECGSITSCDKNANTSAMLSMNICIPRKARKQDNLGLTGNPAVLRTALRHTTFILSVQICRHWQPCQPV